MELAIKAEEGHLPSSFSIVDVINHLYENVLRINQEDAEDPLRDIFVLSKGHGALALYVVLNKFGLLSEFELGKYGSAEAILGGHPDRVSTPYIEASTGSLGHGFPFAVGIALGSQLKETKNRVFVLLGDGECHEGSVWEAANIASNQNLTNLVAIVDWNDSAKQLMPIDDLSAKWESFGWSVNTIDGHDLEDLRFAFSKTVFSNQTKPHVVICRNTKGKGVPLLEGHGVWHHKIPNAEEASAIRDALS